MVVLSFVLSGLGVYYLVLYLSHNRWGAMVAGLVFSLSPYHFLRLELGHLNLSSMQWIPFYILFLLKFVDQGRRRFAFLSILFMVLNALSSWYYVVACGLLSLAVVAWHPRGEVSLRNRALRAGLVLAASLIASGFPDRPRPGLLTLRTYGFPMPHSIESRALQPTWDMACWYLLA
jgi:hypothetical protein